MPHWNLDNPLLLHHYHIRTFMPDEDLGFFFANAHVFFRLICHTHTHTFVYRRNRGLYWFMYIWSYMYNWHFGKMLFLHCLYFSSRQKCFLGEWSDLFLLVWRQKWDFDCLKWILRSCSSFLVLTFTTTVHIFLLACILDVNVTLHLAFTTGCLV